MDAPRRQRDASTAEQQVVDGLALRGLAPEDVPEEIRTVLRDRARRGQERLFVGRYLVTGELGRGGMGVVYRAWDPGIQRAVAIKTLEPDLVPEEDRVEVIQRFRRETRIVGQLRHRSIVTIFDSGVEHGQDPLTGESDVSLLFYVMEYLEGVSVARRLRETGKLSEEEAVCVAADVARALQLAHDAGVIHRDIKPSNVFLRASGHAVLLDFGIAKAGDVPLTRQGQILGTPSYLAPERLREKEIAIDGRADIFSLGVLLFTMLTGEAPFVGEDVYDVIDKIVKETHPRLDASTPARERLARLVDRMLAKRPDERFDSANDVVAALEEIVGFFRGPVMPQPLEVDESGRAKTTPSQPLPPVQVPSGVANGASSADSPSARAEPVESEASFAPREESTRRARPPTGSPTEARSGAAAPSYAEHSPVNDETTDETLADADQIVPEEIRNAPLARTAVPAGSEAAKQSAIATQAVRRSRPKRGRPIEASLVDEAEVIVRPVPLSDLKPDELPTQAQFALGGEVSIPVVDVPSDGGAALDPAEFAREFSERRLSARLGAIEVRERSARSEQSAAVARKTFGTTKADPDGHRSPPPSPVRVRGDLPESYDRSRGTRRTVFLLLCAAMASVAVGVLIGKTRSPSRAALAPATDDGPGGPRAEPQGILRNEKGKLRPRSLRPRTAREILVDAQAARLGGDPEEAARLFDNAMRAASEGSATQAKAALGRADLLRELGRRPEAAALYRTVAEGSSGGRESRQAWVALKEMGFGSKRRASARAASSRANDGRADDGRAEAGGGGEAASRRGEAASRRGEAASRQGEAANADDRASSPEKTPPKDSASPKTAAAKCRAIGVSTLGRPKEAIRRLRALEDEHPNASCVFFALGLRHEEVNDARAALSAYRKFIQLAPKSPRRPAVDARIRTLEAKLPLQ